MGECEDISRMHKPLVLLIGLHNTRVHAWSVGSATCSYKHMADMVTDYVRCWEEEADNGASYCSSLVIGEQVCRERGKERSCEGREETRLVLWLERGKQARELISLGWGTSCPLLKLWEQQVEQLQMVAGRSRHRDILKIFTQKF